MIVGTDGNTIQYTPPIRPKKALKRIRVLLIIMGIISVVNLATLVIDMAPSFGDSWDARNAAIENPAFTSEERDAVRLVTNALLFLFGGMVLGLIFMPFRYIGVLRIMDEGKPGTFGAIRSVAALQLVMEIFRLAFVLVISLDLESLQMGYDFGINAILAIVVLVLLRNPAVRAFYSPHEFKRLRFGMKQG